jgi:DNA polymerase-3 subunit gamma/tau
MRDGLSLLDQCASATTGELTDERVYTCLGIAGIQQCGMLMAHIAAHDTAKALALVNTFYAEGKDMGALLDEMACLTRDFLLLKTAPAESIQMLSGVASDKETAALAQRFSHGELVRMLDLIRQTAAGFTRSTSRRLDAELCIVNLCQPDLVLDAQSMNARLSRLEDQLKSGVFTVKQVREEEPEEEMAPPPDDWDAPPVENALPEPQTDDTPIGFWTDVATQIRKELKPPVLGFFSPTPNAPIRAKIQGSTLVLICNTTFVMESINKPDILELVARKASAKLGRPIQVTLVDQSTGKGNSEQMEQLLRFGRAHSDIIKIKE